MENIFNLAEHIRLTGTATTVADYALKLHRDGHCSSVDECTEFIRLAMRSRGLGDTISKITHALHISECGGCAKRRELLNKLVPYNG